MTWFATLTAWDVAVQLRCTLRDVFALVASRRLPVILAPPGVYRFSQHDVDLVRRT